MGKIYVILFDMPYFKPYFFILNMLLTRSYHCKNVYIVFVLLFGGMFNFFTEMMWILQKKGKDFFWKNLIFSHVHLVSWTKCIGWPRLSSQVGKNIFAKIIFHCIYFQGVYFVCVCVTGGSIFLCLFSVRISGSIFLWCLFLVRTGGSIFMC